MTTGGDHLLPVHPRRRLLTRIPPVRLPIEPARSPDDDGVAEPDELRLEEGQYRGHVARRRPLLAPTHNQFSRLRWLQRRPIMDSGFARQAALAAL